MATRPKKSDAGGDAPKRPRSTKAKTGTPTGAPELSSSLPPSEVADMGAPGDGIVAPDVAPVDAGQVAERAYQLYEESGSQPGNDLSHWLQAEAEIRGRFRR